MDPPRQILLKATTSFAHKVVSSMKLQPIFETIKFPTHHRACQKLSSNLTASTKKRKRGLIYRLPQYYNNIPAHLKFLSAKKFKLRLQKLQISDIPID